VTLLQNVIKEKRRKEMKKTVWEIYQPYANGMVAEGLNERKGFVVAECERQISDLWNTDQTFRATYPFVDEQGIAFDTGREVRDDVILGTWGTGYPNEGVYKHKKHYANRDIIRLDKEGEYYSRHVQAMTAEGLEEKDAIAGELAHRDRELDRLTAMLKEIAELVCDNEDDEGEGIIAILEDNGFLVRNGEDGIEVRENLK